ncbi:E3 ubiquitin-protein ligase RNF25 isoform X2 [Ceratina calcarata]|uniref:E3 ubiquitin-protein ligase RNF25 isoform X2 n=1 Tax=Ceratina calcarata TaxID=156304 RepID=A0AAJ7JEW4_9HYME|nr:E3 ubiquitin-protein ligase RNF25 isoform X2 [Ceratina calcarata]
MSDTTVVDERVADEIEALRAILLDDELHIKENERGEPECIETVLFPSTGEDSQSQYVCVTLIVRLPVGYPDTSPTISLRNPRGLDEDTVRLMRSDAEAKCKDFIGQPVMFELIELIREHLTRSNLPTDQCAVCLYGFRDGDEFTKTECYHYFHSHCLAAHIAAAERYYREEQEKLPQWQQDATDKFQAICPVCRESINCDVDSLWSAPPPVDVEAATDFSVTTELRELQKQMAALFLRQQQKGGIIDLEAEGVKTLVRTELDGATTEGPNPPGTSLNTYSSPAVQQESAVNHHHTQHQNNQHHHHHHHHHQMPQSKQSSHQTHAAHCQSRQLHYHHGHNNNHGHRSRGRGRGYSSRRQFDRVSRQTESTPR